MPPTLTHEQEANVSHCDPSKADLVSSQVDNDESLEASCDNGSLAVGNDSCDKPSCVSDRSCAYQASEVAAHTCVSEQCEFDEVTKCHDLDRALFGLSEDREYESLSRTLGFKVTRYTQAGVTFKVELVHRVCRPSPIGWILNGGTSLALAEIAAGLASFALCPKDSHPVGSAVTANHTSMAKIGEVLTVTAEALHVGKTTHVVNVDITAEDGRLVSTARVTNTIISPQGTEGSAQLKRIEAAKTRTDSK